MVVINFVVDLLLQNCLNIAELCLCIDAANELGRTNQHIFVLQNESLTPLYTVTPEIISTTLVLVSLLDAASRFGLLCVIVIVIVTVTPSSW